MCILRRNSEHLMPNTSRRYPVVFLARIALGLAVAATGSAKAAEKEITASVGIKLLEVPAGKFLMGDENKLEVTISKPFYLGQTEITQSQWKAVMGTEPWWGQPYAKDGPAYAASYITFDDAQAFCVKLTAMEQQAGKISASIKYMLPTEAQWEYACRAGTTTFYSFGDNETVLGDYAWFDKNAWVSTEKWAREVSGKKPSPWGFHDMHGNVYEWCSDWCDGPLVSGADPIGPPAGPGRVFRGGSWDYYPSGCRSASRRGFTPTFRTYFTGFRVLRTVE